MTMLPALNKIFERLLSFHLGEFYCSIMSDFITAYRRQHSCDASLRLTEDWRRCLDTKEIVAVVSMDLSKIFVTIPHQLFIAKSRAYGIYDMGCALLSNYLTGTVQRVKVSDTFSNWLYAKEGVPQERSWTYVLLLIHQRSILSHKNSETEYIC